MRPWVAILVLLIYSLALLRPIAPYLEYYANQKYIATHLCVNRDKPWMHCDGKCYLHKKLVQAAKQQEKENRKAITTIVRFTDYSGGFFFIRLQRPAVAEPDKAWCYIPDHYSFLYSPAVFHPPTIA